MGERKLVEVISHEAVKFAELLSTVDEGQVITYEDLMGAIGASVWTPRLRGCLNTARTRIQNERGFVFAAVNKVGVRRLEPSEIVKEGSRGIEKISRSCRRTTKKVACADYERLSNADKIKHNAVMSVFGALSLASSIEKSKRIEAAVKESGKALSIADSIEFMK